MLHPTSRLLEKSAISVTWVWDGSFVELANTVVVGVNALIEFWVPDLFITSMSEEKVHVAFEGVRELWGSLGMLRCIYVLTPFRCCVVMGRGFEEEGGVLGGGFEAKES